MNNIISSKTKIFFVVLIVFFNIIAKESGDDEVHQVKVGNFAVPGTMQPGPLLGFGQNIVDQYDTLGVFYSIFNLGKDLNFTHIVPEVLYGLRDDLSIILAFPIAKNRYGNHSSSGMSDVIVQMEYALFADHTPTYTNQISLVGSMAFPSGNECKNPSIGFGSPSFFLGFVLEHLATEWYAYTSYGGFITTKNDTGIQSGNQFLYQAGFGKNIAYSPNRWIFMWMVEFSGIYQKKSKINGCVDNNSGSNSILIGPALWFSTDRVIVQAGAAPFVYQNLFGCGQLRSSCFISVYTGFRF